MISQYWIITISMVIAMWTIAATIASIADKEMFGLFTPTALQTIGGVTGLFFFLVYLPFGLKGGQLAVETDSPVVLWIALAPTLTGAIALTVISWFAGLLLGSRSTQCAARNRAFFQVAITVLILINCCWWVLLDQSLRNHTT